MKARFSLFAITALIGLITIVSPVTAQSGTTPIPVPMATVTPDPAQLDQTAEQLQVAANAALASAQAAVANAQAAANAAAQAKITAAEARQRANALEAQAATEKALLAERQADDATQTARTAVDTANEAMQRAAEAVHQFTLAQNEQARLRVELTGARNQVTALQAQLRDRQTIIEQHVNDLRQAITWLGLIGIGVCVVAMRQARHIHYQRNAPTAAPTSSITIDHDTAEAVPDPLIAALSPEMREHID